MMVKTLLTLRSVVPAIPKEPGERAHLKKDLYRIGCIGLLSKPWAVKDERMVRELTKGAPNQYEGTVRAWPETWGAERWREAYKFGTGGEGFASRTNKFIGGKFQNAANPKDKFAIANYEDSRAKRVLEFLIPILYPEKPTWMTVTVGNTIFGTLLGEWKVDWGVVLQAVVAKLVEGARKLKATSIGPYLFHLYRGQELLSGEEIGNITLQDVDIALSQVARKQDVAERDSRITQLTREKEELQSQLRKKERELKLEQSKTQGAHRLIGFLEEHVRSPGDLVINAQLYDEAIAKTKGVTASR